MSSINIVKTLRAWLLAKKPWLFLFLFIIRIVAKNKGVIKAASSGISPRYFFFFLVFPLLSGESLDPESWLNRPGQLTAPECICPQVFHIKRQICLLISHFDKFRYILDYICALQWGLIFRCYFRKKKKNWSLYTHTHTHTHTHTKFVLC